MIKKEEILQRILEKIQSEIETAEKSAKAAHDEATHADTKQESKYDTRAIEASYLAGAQYERARMLKGYAQILQNIPVKNFDKADSIEVGAIVELEHNSVKSYYFLLPKISGVQLELEQQKKLVTLTPESALGRELLGLYLDDEVELPNPKGKKTFSITDIL